MSSAAASLPYHAAAAAEPAKEETEVEEKVASQVDSFLVEALDNPRHRLMVLRMELDVQKFMQNPHLHEFEFQHLPTSYLRCAAHRVAQHYGLETMVADSKIDGSTSRIVARKTPESRFPAISLSGVPRKQPKNYSEATERSKFFICQRPKVSQSDATDVGTRKTAVKTVEERKEEYDRARARIFDGSNFEDNEDLQPGSDGGSLSSVRDDQVNFELTIDENNKVSTHSCRSRVAVFKDVEKDRSDPDYDRSYKRYIWAPAPDFQFSPSTFDIVPPFVQYHADFLHSASSPRNQPPVNFGPSLLPTGPSCAVGYQQASGNAVYSQWLTPALTYPHCYQNLSHMISQVPLYQSFDHLRNG